ncbi:MAG: polymer-forming cytoskeletal protein [Pseudomonadota bacterium]
MFSKSRVNDPGASPEAKPENPKTPEAKSTKPMTDFTPSTPKEKAPASVLSSDLKIHGNLTTAGDIQIEGTIEGDIRAHLLTVGESATVKGECIADDVIVNGRVVGKVRGLKVRLTATARVEGDIIHKTIAIESGAHFEGSVQRQEDPLGGAGAKPKPMSSSTTPPPSATGNASAASPAKA